ncbi:MAG TPA: hypothetical protein DEO84_05430 [candidate division Zixibacteria bacterium]|nr:hypothetical protein [candidate division Zixibacteria bacterium]HBZ00747.1 hypothetical protein [candidate division Zixibacteria bacterium]
MRSIFKITVLFSVFLLFACGGPARRSKPGVNADKRTFGEARINPLGDQDDAIITSDVPELKKSGGSDGILLPAQKPSTAKQSREYFSVQVFASKSSSEAKEFKNSLSSRFQEEIRVDYQAPYYKVCVGRITTFEEAEALLQKVNGMGFTQAWLVRVRK